jgi:hypothetical protein
MSRTQAIRGDAHAPQLACDHTPSALRGHCPRSTKPRAARLRNSRITEPRKYRNATQKKPGTQAGRLEEMIQTRREPRRGPPCLPQLDVDAIANATHSQQGRSTLLTRSPPPPFRGAAAAAPLSSRRPPPPDRGSSPAPQHPPLQPPAAGLQHPRNQAPNTAETPRYTPKGHPKLERSVAPRRHTEFERSASNRREVRHPTRER